MQAALRLRGHDPVVYHAGMDEAERHRAQDRFMAEPVGGGGGHQRLRDGHRQAGHPLRHPRQHPPRGGGLLPGGGARRPRREAGARAAPLQPRRRLHPGAAHREQPPVRGGHRRRVERAPDGRRSSPAGSRRWPAAVGASEFEVSAALRILEREGLLEMQAPGGGAHGIRLLDGKVGRPVPLGERRCSRRCGPSPARAGRCPSSSGRSQRGSGLEDKDAAAGALGAGAGAGHLGAEALRRPRHPAAAAGAVPRAGPLAGAGAPPGAPGAAPPPADDGLRLRQDVPARLRAATTSARTRATSSATAATSARASGRRSSLYRRGRARSQGASTSPRSASPRAR